MAGKAKKKTVSKINSNNKSTNSMKISAKSTKKKNSKKNNSSKKKTTIKKTQVKPANTKVVKKVEEKKDINEVLLKQSNIKLELKKIKNVAIENKNKLVKKYKELPKYIRWLIIVFVVCSLILIIEGFVFVAHNKLANKNTVFHDSYSAITIDDGYLVIVGNSDFKYSDLNTYTKGNARGKLIKYTNSGDIVFEKEYERGISTSFNDVITVSDGYIVVGTGIFSEEEQENEVREAFIIKYDNDGALVWEKFYQVLTNTSFNKVVETTDGYIVVGQSIYANMELGNHTTGGGIIVKYDKDGNEVWHNNHGGTKSGNFNDLVVVNGDIYVVGKDGADSANLVKFNSDGEYQWHKNYSYTDSFGFGGIAYLDNYLYVVGSKKILPEGTTDDDERSTSNTDALLIKYDLDGNIVFERTFGGSSYERYNSILVYHNNFYVVGHICSHDAGLRVTTDEDAEMTGLVVRYDKNGNILKKETFGGSNNDNLTDIATDGISFYAVGYSNSGDGNIKTARSNSKDYFGKLVKLNNRFKLIYAE